MTSFDVEIRKDSRGTWVKIVGHDGSISSVRAEGWLRPDAPPFAPTESFDLSDLYDEDDV